MTNDGKNWTIKSIKIRENYMYLRILEADSINQAERNKKRKVNTSVEQENYSTTRHIVEISLKG